MSVPTKRAAVRLLSGAIVVLALLVESCTSDARNEPPLDSAAAHAADSGDDGSVASDAARPIDAELDARSVDVGADASIDLEVTACANLATIAPCGPASMDPATCLDGFLDLRSRSQHCMGEYEAWRACVTTLDACPAGDGVYCPVEYSQLGMCVSS